MPSLQHAVRTLTLSLTLTAAGSLCVGGPLTASALTSSPVSRPASTPVSTPASTPVSSPARTPLRDPVGGRQLAAGGVIVNLGPGVPPPPVMPGASFLLADMNTGQILVAKAPHARHLPASTLKTLTALTLIPLLNPNAKLVVKPRDVAVDGTRLGILPGTSYRIGMLFQGLLMVSGNDAAFALARGNHSVAATLKAMNATAAHLNAFDTVAKDPSGLDKAGQRTSAYDLALIGRAAMKLPDFRRYVRTKVASMPGGWAGGKLKPGFKINSHNKLLFNYPGTIGIKTGYTNAAKATFIGAATRGGKTYLITQMSSPNGSWRPSAALLNWAFAHGRSVTPIGKLVEPGVPAKPKPAALPTSPKKTISLGASAGQPALPAWLGVAGGISLLALLGGGLTRRNTGRNRSKHRSR